MNPPYPESLVPIEGPRGVLSLTLSLREGKSVFLHAINQAIIETLFWYFSFLENTHPSAEIGNFVASFAKMAHYETILNKLR